MNQAYLVRIYGMYGPDDLHELALEAMTKLGSNEGGEFEFEMLVPEKSSGGAATCGGADCVVSILCTGCIE